MTKTSGVPGSAKYVKTSTEFFFKKKTDKNLFFPKKGRIIEPDPRAAEAPADCTHTGRGDDARI